MLRLPLLTGRRPLAALPALALFALATTLPGASFNPRPYLEGSGYRAERDSVIVYQADSLYMDVDGRRSLLHGQASIAFQGMTLDSPSLELDWKRNRVEAWTDDPVPADSCGGSLALGPGQSMGRPAPGAAAAPPEADSLGREPWPVFTDGEQVLYGRRMTLDLKTHQGRVLQGRTAEDPSRYGGARIKRVADREMHVSDAVFTTCDADCPHYHFQARQLKMLMKDRVLARDVTLHFGKVPTLYSPIAMFSLKRGRASGLILPAYGQTDREGRKLEHLGWYWAVSDTWDTQFRASYAENGPDWLFVNHTPYRFNKTDSGRLSASYNLARTSSREGWDLRWNHRQGLTPYIALTGDVSLASSTSYYEDTSDNLETRLTRNLYSRLSLTGKFPQQGIGWSLGATADQDLADTEDVSIAGTAPSLSLTFPSMNPFDFLAEHEGPGAAAATWLAGGLLSLNSSAESRYTMTGWNVWSANNRRGARHTASFAIPGKLGVLSLTPRVGAVSEWVDETRELTRAADGGLDTTTVAGLAIRNTYSLSLGASTKLYGIARPEIGRLLALRHVLTPSATLSWAPDFSSSRWGYVQEADYVDDEGQPATARLDRFTGTIYSATPSRRRLSLGFGLSQVFQAKWKAPQAVTSAAGDRVALADSTAGADSLASGGRDLFAGAKTAEPIKTQLFTVNTTSSYDFTKETRRLGDLRSNWSADPLQAVGTSLGPLSSLNVSVSTVHTVYKTDYATGQSLDRYIWQDGAGQAPRLPRLTSASVGLGTSFGGKGGGGDAFLPPQDDGSGRFDPVFGDSDLSIPWNLNLDWNWSRNSADPTRIVRRQTLRAGGSIRMATNWKVSSSLQYDIEDRSLGAYSLTIYRDMHCWDGRLVWTPRGANPSYHLLIAVKSDMLQDLKWDKKRGRTSSFGNF